MLNNFNDDYLRIITENSNGALLAQMQHSKCLNNFSRILRTNLGIEVFGFHRIRWDSKHTLLCTHPPLHADLIKKLALADFSIASKLPHFVESEYIFLTADKVQDLQQSIYVDHNFWHGIGVLRFAEGYVDTYVFCPNINNEEFRELHITAQYSLLIFIDHFNKNFLSKVDLSKEEMWEPLTGGVIAPSEQLESTKRAQKVRTLIQDIAEINAQHDSPASNLNDLLSPREQTCLQLLATGLTAKGIAQEMGISFRTVEFYIQNIKDKTGYRYKNELIQAFHGADKKQTDYVINEDFVLRYLK